VCNIVSAVNLHSKFIQVNNRRADLYWKKSIEKIQSNRDHCKKHSHRWQLFNKRLVRMKKKCTHQMRDYQHKISNKIITNTRANTIIIGDLSVKKMAKNKKGRQMEEKVNQTELYIIPFITRVV
jgi:putative transposase